MTHDQDEALSLSDRVVVLQGGQVQQIDTPEKPIQPANRFVADFLGIANFLDGELTERAARIAGAASALRPSAAAGRTRSASAAR